MSPALTVYTPWSTAPVVPAVRFTTAPVLNVTARAPPERTASDIVACSSICAPAR